MIKVAIYVRVSTAEQAAEGYSIGEQTERLTMFCKAHDWCIYRIYTDAGYTGANTNRPALQSMLTAIKSGHIDKVLVYKLDRLSRSQKDTLKLIEDEFLPNGTDFESMSESLDTSTAQGRLFLGILAAFAQLEREMIRDRMSMGLSARVKEGKWKGGTAPYGYRYADDTLHIDPYESMVVQNIFDWWNQGLSTYVIHNRLIDSGYADIDGRHLRYILKNRTYCGYIRHHGDWLKGRHQAIISEAVFEQAQSRFSTTKGTITPASTYLGGLIYCARCGAKYAKVKSGHHYNYACYSRCKKVKHMVLDPNCTNTNYRTEDLDGAIFDQIRKLSIDTTYISQLQSKANSDAHTADLIQSQVHQLSNQISRYMDLYAIGRYDVTELDAKVLPLQDQRAKLLTELDRLKTIPKMPPSQVQTIATSFTQVLSTGNFDQIRSLIEQLISRIDIDGDDVTIHWKFA